MCIQVFGQALMPATALLEAAGAAAALLLEAPGGTGATAAVRPALLGAAIPAPMRIGPAGALALDVSLMPASRASPSIVSIRSTPSGEIARPALHLTAQLAACGALPWADIKHAAGGPAACLAALVGLSEALPAGRLSVGGQVAPTAVGRLATEGHREGSGFWAHPAASDACLHLGASLGVAAADAPALAHKPAQGAMISPGRSSPLAAAAVATDAQDPKPAKRVAKAAGGAGVRVPVALEAALAPRRCVAGSAAWAAVGCVEPLADGGALSSYVVRGGVEPTPTLTLVGLHAARMQAAGLVAVQLPESSARAAGMLYETEWRAVLAICAVLQTKRPLPRHTRVAAWRLQPALGAPAAMAAAVCSYEAEVGARLASLGHNQSYLQAGRALAATAASLATVQRLAAAAGASGSGFALPSSDPNTAIIKAQVAVQLWTATAVPRGLGAPTHGPHVSGAGAVGILRVAAQEVPGLRWEALHVDSCAAHSKTLSAYQRLGLDNHAADGFGTVLSQGALLQPQMLRRPAVSARGLHQNKSTDLPVSGSMLVTGGLGGIGAVVGGWLSAWPHHNPKPGTHVWLFGRSSHPVGGLPVHLTASSCTVSAARCDVGTGSEVQALVKTLAMCAPPLSGLLHAGGSLEDATLHNQALTSLRRVAAPKLAGAACLGAAAATAPLAAVALFSSMSALLGPSGQANYAAANSAMCAAAIAQQAAGKRCCQHPCVLLLITFSACHAYVFICPWTPQHQHPRRYAMHP